MRFFFWLFSCSEQHFNHILFLNLRYILFLSTYFDGLHCTFLALSLSSNVISSSFLSFYGLVVFYAYIYLESFTFATYYLLSPFAPTSGSPRKKGNLFFHCPKCNTQVFRLRITSLYKILFESSPRESSLIPELIKDCSGSCHFVHFFKCQDPTWHMLFLQVKRVTCYTLSGMAFESTSSFL